MLAGWQHWVSNEEEMAAAVPAWPRWHQPKWRPTRSLESITMGDKQASRQSFSPSDWRLIGGRQLLGKSRRELTLLVHFFWVPSSFPSPFFACKKNWALGVANRSGKSAKTRSLSLLFYSLPVPGSPGRHYRFVIIKITSIKRPVDGHRHNGPEWRHWEEGEEKHSLNAAK